MTTTHEELNAVIRQHSEWLAAQLLAQRESLFSPNETKSLRKFTSGEAAALLGVNDSYLRKLHLDGKGPSPEVTGGNRRLYSVKDIQALRHVLEKTARKPGDYLPGRREGDHLQIIGVMNFKGGSGKTTMLNALSKMIDPGERVLTIEDAAELRLQQPHWLPLETRPANLEGQGEISIRDLVKNALRMRPDRIILGEIRGQECFDLLAAMNTGHDGSMCTLHSNSPREALGRMENMVMMGDIKIPKEAISRQIADSVDLIIQVKRLRDGSRRVTNITEVIGMEGPVIVTQELFKFEYLEESADGKIIGEYRSLGLRPYTLDKARQFGFDQAFLEACL